MNKLALSVLTCLFLAACAPEGAPAPETVVSPLPAESLPAPEAVPETVEPEPLDAGRLVGLTPKDVQALVGEPALVRREDNVQVMLFENPTCVFEVVFYQPAPDAHYAAQNLAARTRRGAATDTTACLATLLPDGRWRTP